MNYARIYPQARSFHAIHNCSIRTGYSFLSFNIFILFIFIIREKNIMKKEKSWTVNVPKLFAINILFTGNANQVKNNINYFYNNTIL